MKKKEANVHNILDETPRGNWSTKDAIKKLGEEVQELTWGVARKDTKNIKEEIGDCALLLLKIMKDTLGEDVSLDELAVISAKKVRKRNLRNIQEHKLRTARKRANR